MLFQSIEIYEIALFYLFLANVQQTEHYYILPVWKVLREANIIVFLLEPRKSIKYCRFSVMFSVVNIEILFSYLFMKELFYCIDFMVNRCSPSSLPCIK